MQKTSQASKEIFEWSNKWKIKLRGLKGGRLK